MKLSIEKVLSLIIQKEKNMKLLRNTVLTMFFLLVYLQSTYCVQYISLGRDCQVAGELVSFNLRSAAYPLDWMGTSNFYGIVQAFEDDFQHLLDPAVLEYRTTYIENVHYQFHYNHFFPIIGEVFLGEVCVAGTIVPNYLEYLPIVKEVQERRIGRLINLLSSKETVFFIRTYGTPDEAIAFTNTIKQKYPELDFMLVIVHERVDWIGNWNIPNVLNFFVNQRSGFADWWSKAEWANIFQLLNDWLNTRNMLEREKPSRNA